MLTVTWAQREIYVPFVGDHIDAEGLSANVAMPAPPRTWVFLWVQQPTARYLFVFEGDW